MKTIKIITTFIGIAVLLFTVGCDEESKEILADFSAENAIRAAQVDGVIEGSQSLVDNAFSQEIEGRSMQNSFFPPCATITLILNDDGSGILNVDFGEGCTLSNGTFVTGAIVANFEPVINGSRSSTYIYENYTYNGHIVTGGGDIVRVFENENGNPESTINDAIEVQLANSDIEATRTGTRIAEWVAGVGSGTWLDNVYHINGNWNTTFTNDFSRSGLVTQTLVRELSCPHLVSGQLQVTQTSFTGVVDWGDGTCDNLATLEVNGQVFDIEL